MNTIEQQRFIHELIENVKADILKESGKYPENWDGVELRWRIADIYSQIVYSDTGKRKGKRYQDYRNTVLVNGLI